MLMTEELLLRELSEIVNRFDVFKVIALNMEWIEISELHEDWFRSYPLGIMIDLYHFPKGYVKKYFKECYIRCRIAETAYYEEWDKDYFNVPKKERLEYINTYETVTMYKELRLKKVSCDALKKEIEFYATVNGITMEEQKRFYPYIEGANIIEIGGCYSGDHSYIAVQGDTILTIDCGIWD